LSIYHAGRTGTNGLLLGYGIAESQRIPELVRRLRLAADGLAASR
ncbi:MAG: hypothetical protein IV103_09645, partial [Zoogloea sp.]|nr:hypothetical protein [Zoogloea sp.]